MSDAEGSKDLRVKVYQLNKEGQWDDMGTGQILLNPIAEEQTFELSVQCEETNGTLLEHKIVRDFDYARQGPTIITWCQPGVPDSALSFQEASGCENVWIQIVAVIGPADEHDASGSGQGGQAKPVQVELPEPVTENVEAILMAIGSTPNNHREFLASALLQDDYLKKLLEEFKKVDRSGSTKICFLFFELFKQIVLLNEISIYEVLFSDDVFKILINVFDYDPTIKPENRMQHRKFWSRAKFKEVMDIKEPSLVKKIHENYRMTYFKDVVLLRFLDDGALNTLGSLIYYNNATIIAHITENPSLIQSLFEKINKAVRNIQDYNAKGGVGKEGSSSDSKSKDPFLFLQELCTLIKSLQVPHRDAFYNALVDAEVFSSVEDALWAASPEKYPWVWQASVDMLHNMLIHDSAMLRSFLVSRIPSKKSLLTRLVTMMVSNEVTPGLVHQLGEILRMVLDPDAMQTDDKDIFLDHFYKMNMIHIDHALSGECKNHRDEGRLYNALELFSMCARQHGVRAKVYILGHRILQKAVKVIDVGDKRLTLSVIRLIRTCIGSKDPGYASIVERNRLLDPVINLFVANGARYNLLNSNVIELLDLIQRENLKNLVSYVMQEHGAKFEKVSYVDTFRLMQVQHDNNMSQDSAIDSKEEKTHPPDGITEERNCEYTYFEEDDDGEDEKAPVMELDNEDGFVPRKAVEDDAEDDLMAAISKRQKVGKLKSKMLPKKITVSRKSPVLHQTESPKKKRRLEEVKS
mmetsp:Transcript_11030/g.16499  ORF Transcript_11030/g.16499 Transcript_11030/m.16499 type:complete len:750 (-) Transcript_11030:143-2392(-)|eukprot:CAMPEP_0167744238 /NCGR_PEP_ID=MMETSP0110_2-20121227/2477_1 /TAXON_ID=629695 /ORGANISM="Gymnochlora sp., Strain CCMP2014" /LENGTH=749 /DNA_ID=CAMNT_0007628731 /DNA_START=42 /DNA_END=2291 /DNA_ORIENTATION=+